MVVGLLPSASAGADGNSTDRSGTMLMSTAAIGLVATLLTAPAQADRMCRKVCHDGFCKSECVSSGHRPYMHEHDRYNHRHDMHGPGVNVEINR